MPKYLIYKSRLYKILHGNPTKKEDTFQCLDLALKSAHYWYFDPETDIVFENYWHARRHMIKEYGK